MFIKYFGAFIIIAGIFGGIISLFFNGIYIDGYNKIKIQSQDELLFGIIIALIISIPAFLVGRYFWNIGKSRETIISVNLKEDKISKKFINFSVISIIIGIFLFPIAFFIVYQACSNTHCDGFGVVVLFFIFGVIPAGWFGFVAITLILLNIFREKIKKPILRFIYYFLFFVTIIIVILYLILAIRGLFF